MKRNQQLRPRREIFVFTPGEKRAAAGVLAAFLLGLATMHYRATHRSPPPPLTAKQQRDAKQAKARSHRSAAKAAPTPAREDADDE